MMNKLKAITRSVSFNHRSDNLVSSKNNRQEKDKIEPVVGFKLTLHESASDNTCGEFMGKFLNFNGFLW